MTTIIDANVKRATSGDEARVLTTLTAAFADDPAVRWMYRRDDQYRRHFPGFVRAFGGRALTDGVAYVTDGFAGAALWLPPGVEPDETSLMAHIEASTGGMDQSALLEMFEEMGSYHPKEPHWYLSMIGVDPQAQGKGIGAKLMRYSVARCDQERALAYLETANPRNIPLYERFGFEVMEPFQIGAAPKVTPMLRRPR